MKFKTIEFSFKDKIATIKLNRPEKRNSLNPEMISELTKVFQLLNKNKNIKLVVIEGNGKTFCAGMDLLSLKKIRTNSFKENLQDAKKLINLLSEIYQSPKLVIAKIKGEAFAGGAGLASVCDIIFAENDSRFCYTEVKIGFVPAIVSFFLNKKIVKSYAKDLLLTGRIISANEAKSIGFVNYISSDSEIDNEVFNYTVKISSGVSDYSITETKKILNTISKSEKIDLSKLARINAKARKSKDCKKGIDTFLKKEKIIW